MAVNFPEIQAASLYPIAGVTIGYAEAQIRKPNRKDVLVMTFAPGTSVAGVFTKNRFCAAPVQLCKAHLAAGQGIRALIVNTGNANAGTGELGLANAKATCAALADSLQLQSEQILPFSTGVILEQLPMERLLPGVAVAAKAQTASWFDAAQAIMTTDTLPKAASRQVVIDGQTVTITGVSKGAGMIRPNMATMLGFVATDAKVAQPVLEAIVKYAADRSFNSITIDGDTSTNDSFIIAATGQAGLVVESEQAPAYVVLRDAITELSIELAQLIVRDGEGATKFMTIQV